MFSLYPLGIMRVVSKATMFSLYPLGIMRVVSKATMFSLHLLGTMSPGGSYEIIRVK